MKFRPHHFFCTLGFQGKGYSPEFVENFSAIKSALSDDTKIKVVEFTDDICVPCPSRRNNMCVQQRKIETLDSRHKIALRLEYDQILTWGTAKKRLAQLTIQDHHRICDGCQWKELGVCAEALKEI